MLFTLKKDRRQYVAAASAYVADRYRWIALLWFSRFQRTGKIFMSLGWLLLTCYEFAARGRQPAETD